MPLFLWVAWLPCFACCDKDKEGKEKIASEAEAQEGQGAFLFPPFSIFMHPFSLFFLNIVVAKPLELEDEKKEGIGEMKNSQNGVKRKRKLEGNQVFTKMVEKLEIGIESSRTVLTTSDFHFNERMSTKECQDKRIDHLYYKALACILPPEMGHYAGDSCHFRSSFGHSFGSILQTMHFSPGYDIKN